MIQEAYEEAKKGIFRAFYRKHKSEEPTKALVKFARREWDNFHGLTVHHAHAETLLEDILVDDELVVAFDGDKNSCAFDDFSLSFSHFSDLDLFKQTMSHLKEHFSLTLAARTILSELYWKGVVNGSGVATSDENGAAAAAAPSSSKRVLSRRVPAEELAAGSAQQAKLLPRLEDKAEKHAYMEKGAMFVKFSDRPGAYVGFSSSAPADAASKKLQKAKAASKRASRKATNAAEKNGSEAAGRLPKGKGRAAPERRFVGSSSSESEDEEPVSEEDLELAKAVKARATRRKAAVAAAAALSSASSKRERSVSPSESPSRQPQRKRGRPKSPPPPQQQRQQVRELPLCHRCHFRLSPTEGCEEHRYCRNCLWNAFQILLEDLPLDFCCPACNGFCPCKPCKRGEAKGQRISDELIPDWGRPERATRTRAPEMSAAAAGVAAAKAALEAARCAGHMGHEYLFAKYALLLPQMRATRDRTEDVCFVCKDGGDLVECDIRVAMEGLPTGGQCQKVFHTHCLGFEAGDDDPVTCARHVCCVCGDTASRFCRYCPTSYCSTCFKTDSGKSSAVAATALEPLVVARDQQQQQQQQQHASGSGGAGAGAGSSQEEQKEFLLFDGPEAAGAAPEFLCSECGELARSAVRTHGFLPPSMLAEEMAATGQEEEDSGDESGAGQEAVNEGSEGVGAPEAVPGGAQAAAAAEDSGEASEASDKPVVPIVPKRGRGRPKGSGKAKAGRKKGN